MAGHEQFDVVFLDAAGTLFDVRGSVGEIYSSAARRHGVDASPEELQRAFVRAFRQKSLESIPACRDGERLLREKEWWLAIVGEVFAGRMPPSTLRKYFAEVFEIFRTAAAWRLFPDTLPSLKELKDAGCRLGVISNFDSRLIGLLQDLGIGSFFEQVTISWRVGAAKPDSKIFRCAVEAMDVDASRAVHVGDSLREDFAGASAAGLKAVLLDRRDLHAGWKDGWRVRDLSEFCEALVRS